MKDNAGPDRTLDRLLRSAANAKEEVSPEMPFGFDTRVIALARQNGNGGAFALLLRRVSLIAAALIVLATAGAYFEFNRDSETINNEFAFVDSAVQDEVAQ